MNNIDRTKSSPLVSVCLPIYNEERHLARALSSITSQTYDNIEILISDNASTDSTAAICREFSDRDHRIVFYRQESNIGAINNFFSLADKATGKYMMWGAGHDLWSENLIEECVKVLERDSSTVIAYGRTSWVDEEGRETATASGMYDTQGLDFAAKFAYVLWGSMNPILGVIRKEALPKLGENYKFVGSDLVILLSLITKGDFACATAATFFRRRNRPAENHAARIERYKSDTTKIAVSLFDRLVPLAKLPVRILQVIIGSDLKVSEKAMLLLVTLPALPVKYLVGKKVVR